MRPGDTLHTALGEWHWHGAADHCFMTHLAIGDGTEDPDTVDIVWGEHITDDEYRQAQP